MPLINQAFDARIANVDSYLDWYYSLPADYERLASMITGSAEEFAKEQFSEKIESGIDDTQLKERFEQLADDAAAIKSDLLAQLEQCKVGDEVPSWLMTVKEDADVDLLSTTLQPAEQLLNANQRFGVSAATGLAAGFVTKKLLQRVVKKQFFKTIVSKISSMIGSKAIAAGGGGAVGTAIGGPVGTAVGVAVGVGISVGVDYLTLMADEYLNRESYRAEIIATIDEARADTLALVQQ